MESPQRVGAVREWGDSIRAGAVVDDSARPFEGIRIVEFGQFVAVPFAAQLLGEGGAHVIKIEALEGDPTRRLSPIAPHESRTFISRNRNKHSLPLALSDPGARPVIDALLEWADVILTNFRPGLAEKLGLDYTSLSARYRRLARQGPMPGLLGWI